MRQLGKAEGSTALDHTENGDTREVLELQSVQNRRTQTRFGNLDRMTDGTVFTINQKDNVTEADLGNDEMSYVKFEQTH
jgi:hypothetical protein